MIVVDNGSTDGSLELLSKKYPWVRVLPQGRNLGFAPAVTVGVHAANAQCVALLNNDMRVDPDWVSQLVNRYRPDEGTVCVAGRILSWDGTKLDFGEGSLNFYGMGFQVGFREPAETVPAPDGVRLLFACGGAMLVGRDVFLETGGFDDSFFAYFEDVDFGWRLNIFGYDVRLAAEARAYHRHHGTASRFPDHQKLLLYERNALRTIIKNYELVNAERVLGAALMLGAKRAQLRAGLDRAPYEIGADREPFEHAPRVAIAHIHAVVDLADGLPDVLAKRDVVQARRRRSDDELTELFIRPMQPLEWEGGYVEAQQALVAWLGVDELFSRRRATRIAVVSGASEGPRFERMLSMAESLTGGVEVTFSAPAGTHVRPLQRMRLVHFSCEGDVGRLADTVDLMVLDGALLNSAGVLESAPAVVAVEVSAVEPKWTPALDVADLLVCATPAQSGRWAEILGEQDGRTLPVEVVPEGPSGPSPTTPPPAGLRAELGAESVIAACALDESSVEPLPLVEGLAGVESLPVSMRLVFLEPHVPTGAGAEARDRAGDLGLDASRVNVRRTASGRERAALLAEADLGVTPFFEPSTTPVFRSPTRQYIEAGLPVVTTDADPLSELVAREECGLVVDAADRPALAVAVARLVSDDDLRKKTASRAAAVAAGMTWPASVAPLRELAREPWRWRHAPRHQRRRRYPTEELQTMLEHRDVEIRRLNVEVQRLHAEVRDVHGIVRLLQRMRLYGLVLAVERGRDRLRRRQPGAS